MIWPKPLGDETLYSWLARTARLNAMSSDLAFCDALTGTRSTSIMDAPFNLLMLCEKVAGCLGAPADALRQMTAFHVAANLGNFEDGCIQRIESGAQTFDLTASAFGGFCRWRVCPACMQSDIAEAGVAWWHRAHQLPTSLICSIHGCLLQRFDVKRHRIHEQFILPGDLSGDLGEDQSALVLQNRNFWQEIARIGSDALQDGSHTSTQITAASSFIAGLQQRGLVTRGGNLRRREYVEAFEGKIGYLFMPSMFKRAKTFLEPMSLISGFWPTRNRTEPMLKMLLVWWLYGSWHQYRERCHWESILGLSESQLNRGFLGKTLDDREEHRGVCRMFMENSEDPTRSGLWRLCPHSLRWLRRWDSEWLDDKLPLVPVRRGRRTLF